MPTAHGFVQVDLVILLTFKFTLVELNAEFVIIITIIINGNTLCYFANDGGVQAATKQSTDSIARLKMFMLCVEH